MEKVLERAGEEKIENVINKRRFEETSWMPDQEIPTEDSEAEEYLSKHCDLKVRET